MQRSGFQPKPDLLLDLDHNEENCADGDDEQAVENGHGFCSQHGLKRWQIGHGELRHGDRDDHRPDP